MLTCSKSRFYKKHPLMDKVLFFICKFQELGPFKSLVSHRSCLTCLSHCPPIMHGSVGALTNGKSWTMTVCILRTGELVVPHIYAHIRYYLGCVGPGPAVAMVCSTTVVSSPPSSLAGVSPCPGHLPTPGSLIVTMQ